MSAHLQSGAVTPRTSFPQQPFPNTPIPVSPQVQRRGPLLARPATALGRRSGRAPPIAECPKKSRQIYAILKLVSTNGEKGVGFRVGESPFLVRRHSGAGRNPERLSSNTGQEWQGFLGTGFRRYDGLGRLGNHLDPEPVAAKGQGSAPGGIGRIKYLAGNHGGFRTHPYIMRTA